MQTVDFYTALMYNMVHKGGVFSGPEKNRRVRERKLLWKK